MLTVDTFREQLPEFSDPAKYPDVVIQLQLDVAVNMVNADRWGDLTDTGVGWVAAHLLVLSTKDYSQSLTGRAVGGVQGVQSSKSVDKVSVGYDVGAVTLADGGFWNMTRYGIQYLQFARMFGSGGFQL